MNMMQRGNLVSSRDRNDFETRYEYDALNRQFKVIDAEDGTFFTEYDPQTGNITETTDAEGNDTVYTYDLLDRVLTITDAENGVIEYEYDSVGNVQELTDELDNTTIYTYDELNRQVQIEDAEGNITKISYDLVGNVVEVMDAEENITLTSYDQLNRVEVVTNALSDTAEYKYDENGNLKEVKDESGRVTKYEYDLLNRLIKVTDAEEQVTTTEYDVEQDDGFFATVVTDSLGSIIRRVTDELYREIRVEEELGTSNTSSEDNGIYITKYEYDNEQSILKMIDPNSGEIEYKYDKLYRLTLETNAEEGETEYKYDKVGNLRFVTDPRDEVTEYQYDNAYRLEKEIDAENEVRSYSYDLAGNLTSIKDRRGNITRFEYDELNRQTAQIDPYGATFEIDYDKVGNVIKETDELERETKYDYDELYRLEVVTNDLDDRIIYGYDEVGNVITIQDERGKVTTYEYDDIDRQTKIINALGFETTIDYSNDTDARQLVVKVTEQVSADSNRSSESRTDSRERLQTFTNADGTGVSYSYDGNDNMLLSKDELGRETRYTYDLLNRLLTVTDAENRVVTTDYDANGNVVKTVDELGYTKEYDYDALNRLIGEQDNLNRTVSYDYDEEGNLTEFIDANGGQTHYGYDALNRLWWENDPEGGLTSYGYDSVGNLKSVKDPNANDDGETNDFGHTVTYFYDELNRLEKEVDGSDEKTSYTYDGVGNLKSVTDRRDNVTKYDYDDINRQIKRTDANNKTFLTEYDWVGNVVEETDELGRVTKYEYDLLDRLEKVTYPAIDGVTSSSSSTYDAVGNLLSSTDELGRTTEYEYDKINRQIEIKTPLGFITKFEYEDDTDNHELVLRVTDAENRETVSRADGRGNLVEFVNADGTTTTYSYDGNDNLLTVVDELGRETSYSYDLLNREIRVTTPEGNTTATEYDSNSNVVKITDHLNNATNYTYNELDLLTTETDARGFVTTYTYDEEENLASVKDPLDNVTEYIYDKLNRLETQTQLGIGRRTYSYDEVSNLVELEDRNGRIVQFAYDAWNRQTEELWLDGDNTISYDYDAASQLIEVSDSVAKYEYEYDNDGRLVKETRDTFGFTPEVVLDYAYDGVSNLLTVTDTVDGIQLGTESYTYDDRDRVTTISQNGNGVTPKTAVVTYDDAGQLERLEVQGAFTTTQTFDLDGRPLTRTHTTALGEVLAYGYEFDEVNRITAITSPNGESSFEYDGTDQLTGASSDFQEDESYDYDETGNRLGNNIGPHNRLLNDGVYSYEYDAEGNRIQRTELATGVVTEYVWDWRNRLVEVSESNELGEVVSRSQYQYDAFDRRLTKSVDSDGDGIYELVEGFVYNDDSILLVLDGDEVSQRYFYGPGTDLVLAEETVGEGVEYALTNHLNSVEFILDSAGFVINRIIYDSFGGITSETNPDVDVRYGFTGRDFDSETGLGYYRTRYLDFVTGTFLTLDRLGFSAGDVNLYRYVGNSPTNFVDPSGEFAITAGILIGAAVIGGLTAGGVNYVHQQNAIADRSQDDFNFGEFASATAFGAAVAPVAVAALPLVLGSAGVTATTASTATLTAGISGAISFGIDGGFQLIGNGGNLGKLDKTSLKTSFTTGVISSFGGGLISEAFKGGRAAQIGLTAAFEGVIGVGEEYLRNLTAEKEDPTEFILEAGILNGLFQGGSEVIGDYVINPLRNFIFRKNLEAIIDSYLKNLDINTVGKKIQSQLRNDPSEKFGLDDLSARFLANKEIFMGGQIFPLDKIDLESALGRRNNCVNCVIAGYHILAGRPATALESKGFPLTKLEDYFSTKDVTRRFEFMTLTEIGALLRLKGNGAHGIVYVGWTRKRGHVFNALNVGGKIKFIDFQNPEANVIKEARLRGFIKSETIFLRTDNLEI